MNNPDNLSSEDKWVKRSPKDLGMDLVANHVARYAKLSTDEMIEAIAGDAMLNINPQMLIASFAILQAKFNKQAETTADKNLEASNAVISLTKWLLVLTVVLTLVAGAQVYVAFQQLSAANESNRLARDKHASEETHH